MPRPSPNALSLSHRVLSILIPLNFAAGLLILALLIASIVARDWVFYALGVHGVLKGGGLVAGMRAIMVIGIAAVPLVNVILRRLLAMVETVRDGNAFVPENAQRLKRIAWSVLGLEIMHAVVAAIAKAVSTQTVPIDIHWDLNVTRWLVVLLLFVLAQVFEEGTRMRADLEGTV